MKGSNNFMTYQTDEQRIAARKASRRKYYLKTRKLKGYCKERPWQRKTYSKEFLLWRQARTRAKQAGLVFELEVKDVVIPKECPVLGIPINTTNAKQRFDSPSIDRIDNEKGYTRDNVCVISWRANRLKWNGTVAEFEAILRYMKEKT